MTESLSRDHLNRRRFAVVMAIVALALALGSLGASKANAADSIFANGFVSNHNPNGLNAGTGGAFGTWVNLTQIRVRSLDGHKSCWHAWNGPGAGYTYGYCTNDDDGSPYGAVNRLPHCYSGWSGHYVQMRCRQYW